MKIEQAKQKALKLFQSNGYQTLFEKLYDDVYDGFLPFHDVGDDPSWNISLKFEKGLKDYSLAFGGKEVAIMLDSFTLNQYSASFGCGFFEQDYKCINLVVALMGDKLVIVYEHDFYDDLNPENLYKNSELVDIHEYHHSEDFYAMLDCYRELLKLRESRAREVEEAKLQQRYAGKFTFS